MCDLLFSVEAPSEFTIDDLLLSIEAPLPVGIGIFDIQFDRYYTRCDVKCQMKSLLDTD